MFFLPHAHILQLQAGTPLAFVLFSKILSSIQTLSSIFYSISISLVKVFLQPQLPLCTLPIIVGDQLLKPGGAERPKPTCSDVVVPGYLYRCKQNLPRQPLVTT